MPTLLHILMGAERGGCERLCELLIRHEPNARHRVLVLGPDGPMSEIWKRHGAEVVCTDADAACPSGALIRRLSEEAARSPSAVMIWHGLNRLPHILYALRGLEVPMVVHGGNPASSMSLRVNWKFLLLGWYYPMRRMPTYVCCSHYVADSFDDSSYLRRFPRVVVLNGVERPPERLSPPSLDAARPLTVGMLARLDRIKDQATLLRAFALLRTEVPGCELELAGGGSEEPALRHLAAELNLTNHVRFLGRVNGPYEAMARWDLFAYATTEDEGMGMALAEAMMLGLPCVATDVGPIREVSGGATDLVHPHDPSALALALARLARDAAARRDLAAKAKARGAREFAPEVFAARYSALLLDKAAASREVAG